MSLFPPLRRRHSSSFRAILSRRLFGALLAETVLAPVPHRHLTFTIPKMLRPYFRFHRRLIKELCRIAHACQAGFQRTAIRKLGSRFSLRAAMP
jgi:hypothetical protein